MRIVLVDDENIVLRGISSIISQSGREWSVVAECGSGEDAIPAIKRLNPDVVISDIRMYNVSGIELAEAVKEINPNILVILLTGYAEFDYAQKSIKLNIFDYLLKPTRYNDIIECLSRAEKYLTDRREEQSYREIMEKKLNDYKEAMKEKFLRDLMNGILPVNVDISQKADEYNINFKSFMVLNVSYESQNKGFGTDPADMLLMDFSVKNIFSEIINTAGKAVIFTESIQNFVAIVETSALGDLWQEHIRNLSGRIADILWERLTVKVSYGASEARESLEELLDCCNQACYALNKAKNNNSVYLDFQDAKYEFSHNAYSKSISDAVEYIDKKYREDISLKDVADAVFLNAWYLSDLFSREVGMTFSQYVRDKRIEKSKELLRDKSLKLYEVAYQVGIKEQGYFSSIFKKVIGVTPKSYREQLE